MEPNGDAQLSYADKIAKLLRQAEGTDNANEADAFNARAQSLMIKYAVSEELLAQAEGRQVQDTIVQETIVYKGIFHMALFDIGRAIGDANSCRVLIQKHPGVTQTDMLLIGFKSDVTNVKVLDASLQVQASTAMQRWYRRQDVTGYTAMMKAKMRRQFLMSFAKGLKYKLNLAAQRRGGAHGRRRRGAQVD
jgi:hypothetical protein